jgi:hypothetical protein
LTLFLRQHGRSEVLDQHAVQKLLDQHVQTSIVDTNLQILSRGIPAPWDTRRHISNHAHDAAMADAAGPDMEELRDPAKTGELRGAAGAGQDRAARRTRAHMPK